MRLKNELFALKCALLAFKKVYITQRQTLRYDVNVSKSCPSLQFEANFMRTWRQKTDKMIEAEKQKMKDAGVNFDKLVEEFRKEDLDDKPGKV